MGKAASRKLRRRNLDFRKRIDFDVSPAGLQAVDDMIHRGLVHADTLDDIRVDALLMQ